MDSFIELTRDGIVSSQDVDGVLVVHFSQGRIRDEREVLRILGELGEFVELNPGGEVLVNLENVEYLSSAGLGSLVGLLKRSRKGNGQFKLCCVQPSIYELFEVMRLTKIFEIHDDQDAAIRSFRS